MEGGEKTTMKTYTRDDTEHGVEYVLKSDAEQRIELVAHAGKAAINTLQADMDRLKQRLAVQIHENQAIRDQITELEETSIAWFIAAQELANALRECREDSVELLGQNHWWKDERRCDFQKRYAETKENIARADRALQELKKHPDNLTLRKLYAVILPDGRIIAESHFEDEKKAWTVALGWPHPDEIEHAKKNGARCVLASLVFENDESCRGANNH